jgi:hypothetical protein
MSTAPLELNWVQKRAACTIEEMFNRLSLEISNDIIAINGVLYKDLYFRRDALSDGSLVIGQPARVPRVTVMIGIVNGQIIVQDQTKPERWAVRVGLNNEGRCVLKLEDGSELETWQFRKKALESLFFES